MGKARKALKDRNLRDLEHVLNEASRDRQFTDIQPMHAFIHNMYSVATLCLGTQHDDASSVHSDVTAYRPHMASPRAVMDLS